MAVKTIETTQYNRSSEYALENLDNLPVARVREQLRKEIRLHSNFVLIGETGSGKTTCLPPLLLELRNELDLGGKVGITQPRRIATQSVTERVSDMMGTEVGDTVGYHIRFDDNTSENTDITFMTDGILLRKIQFDPYLTEFSIIMIDEAHERSLNIDLCLGLLKDVNSRRLEANIEPIRIIITSATIERNRFAEYIGGEDQNNSVEIAGKMYPVEVFYEEALPYDYDYTKGAAEKVKGIIDNDLDGDILIFMPGKKEITDTITQIEATVNVKDLEILPLHAELPPEEQDRIFSPSTKRKIIVATNIAETSVTIDGIIHIIDSGLIKQTQYKSRSGVEHLALVEHAISGIEQRKGRAGRTAPGYCYRLYTKESLHRRPRYQTPEIQRSNLSQVVLAMKKVGIEDIENFDFIDHPGSEVLNQAIKELTVLGALDESGNITEIGEWLVELSLEPRLGRMVIEAMKPEINCVNEITIIAALLDGKNIFVRPQEKEEEIAADRAHSQFIKEKDSDYQVFLNIWKGYSDSDFSSDWAKNNFLNEKALEEAKNVRLDLLEVLSNHGIEVDPNMASTTNPNSLGKALASGLIGNLLVHTGRGIFCKADGTKDRIYIHPASVMVNNIPPAGSYVIASEIFMNPQGKTFACNCLEVKREWLKEYAPKHFRNNLKQYRLYKETSSKSHRHRSFHKR